MRRLQWVELEDLPGFPALLRNYMTDYLQFVIGRMKPYHCVADPLRRALVATGTGKIVDLCSGAGGPWTNFLDCVDPEGELGVRVILSDRYPNEEALQRVAEASGGSISWERECVDLTRVPERLDGFRTIFSAFHHFPPETARRVLEDSVKRNAGIGIFEATSRKTAAGMILVPLVVLLVTPMIRPFRWSRILLTYVLPVLPLAIFWDGLVSSLRTYTPGELQELALGLDPGTYTWTIGEEHRPGAPPITYLIGYPCSQESIRAD